ncbi:hypothetical protein BD777DRAFT_128234 [Yarrowia lipolytica]|nr:hypothetical protein BD777DRAFT_128234 [Yarrowia lipolytica]
MHVFWRLVKQMIRCCLCACNATTPENAIAQYYACPTGRPTCPVNPVMSGPAPTLSEKGISAFCWIRLNSAIQIGPC